MMQRLAITMACVMTLGSEAGAQATAPDAPAIITRAARTYRALSALQADFKQRIDDEFLGEMSTRGVLSQSGENRFAMRFTDPANDAIIIDGTRVWVYLPSSMPGQVLRYPMPSGPVYGYNLLALFLDRPLERYRVSYVATEKVDGRRADALRLEPVANDLPFRRATIWFDREDALPRRLEILEKTGAKRTVELSRLRPNVSIAPNVFTFTPPRGVRVVDQKS